MPQIHVTEQVVSSLLVVDHSDTRSDIESVVRIADSLAKQGVRIFGPPPPKGAPKIEAYMYVRRINIRMLPFIVPVWVLLARNAATWAWIVLGVSGASWLQGFASINLRIKRLRDASPNG